MPAKKHVLNFDPGVLYWNLLRGVLLTFFFFICCQRTW